MQTEYLVVLQYDNGWAVIFQLFVQSNKDSQNATIESINFIHFDNGEGTYDDFTAITKLTSIRSTQDLVQLLSYKPSSSSINVSKIMVPGYTDLTGNIFTTLDDLPCAKTISKLIEPNTKTPVYEAVAIGNQGTYFTYSGDPADQLIGTQLFEVFEGSIVAYYVPSTHSGTIYDGGQWDYILTNGVITDKFLD
jgi:hypothetical protein